MGGAVTVPGNVTPFAEANILGDTPAAKAVLASRFQITLVGLDVTLRTLLTRSETRQIRSWGTPQAIQIADMIEYYFRAYQGKMTGIAGCPLHDPLAVGIAVDRSLATVLPLCLTVDTEGPSIGRTVGDVERLAEPQPNVQVCIGVDGGRYVDSFMEVLKSLVGGQEN